MKFNTPLRYPGGKRRLVPLVAEVMEANGLRDVAYLEPYAGGAAMALTLLFDEYASTVHINDLSRPVFAFWKSALDETDALCRRIDDTPVTLDEWHRQREVYLRAEEADLLDLGFAAFFLNRTNRSGVISGRMIGGKEQTGRWKLDARYNKEELTRRIRKIGRYRSRILVSNEDASTFIADVAHSASADALFFIDPPYIERGERLYLNDYGLDDHKRIASQICDLQQRWIVTYDYDAAVRNQLFPNRTRLSFSLPYSAQQRRRGQEAMFLSDSLAVPHRWRDTPSFLVHPTGSGKPLEARVEVATVQESGRASP